MKYFSNDFHAHVSIFMFIVWLFMIIYGYYDLYKELFMIIMIIID